MIAGVLAPMDDLDRQADARHGSGGS